MLICGRTAAKEPQRLGTGVFDKVSRSRRDCDCIAHRYIPRFIVDRYLAGSVRNVVDFLGLNVIVGNRPRSWRYPGFGKALEPNA